MKSLIALALLLLSTPVFAAPENGTFWNPESEVIEGMFLTTSASTKVSFSVFTQDWDCHETIDECRAQQAWFVSDLNTMVLGVSQGFLSASFHGMVLVVGTYTLNETDTGYSLRVVASGGTPLNFDHRIYDPSGFNFSTCIVSPDPTCGL